VSVVFFNAIEVVRRDGDAAPVEQDAIRWIFGIAYGSEEAVDAAVKHDVEAAKAETRLVKDRQADQR
jgi:hypothetical protein